MSHVIITNATAADVAAAVSRATNRKVVYCPSIGDGASPVWLVAGAYSKPIGQAADWRHDIDLPAERNNAIAVKGYWDEEYGWVCSVDLTDSQLRAVENAVLGSRYKFSTVAREVEREERRAQRLQAEMAAWERDRPAREAAEQRHRDEIARLSAQYAELREQAIAKCRISRRTGKPRKDDMATVEYAWKLAITESGYGAYDYDHGVKLLTRLATEGRRDQDATIPM